MDPRPSAVTFWPSKQTSPRVGSIRRSMQRPVVDLPQPDSPTSPAFRLERDRSSRRRPRAPCRASRPRHAALDGEILDQVATAQQRFCHDRCLHAFVQHAGDLVARRHLDERRRGIRHSIAHRRAPRREAASRRRVDQDWARCRRSSRAAAFSSQRDRCAESSGSAQRIGMQRLREQFGTVGLLDDLARVHDDDTLARSRRRRPCRA